MKYFEIFFENVCLGVPFLVKLQDCVCSIPVQMASLEFSDVFQMRALRKTPKFYQIS